MSLPNIDVTIPPAVTDAVASAGAAVASGTAAAGDFIAQIPVPEPVTTFYATVFGEESLFTVLKEWLPIMYVTVLPILCLVFGVFCKCQGAKTSTGSRIKRRVLLAVRGGIRIGSPMPTKKKGAYSGVASLSAAEKGASPVKNVAKDKKEEAAIKKKAAAPKK